MIHPFQSGDWFHERYRLEKLVGMGGFADVWKAYDSLTDTTVALKIYSRLDDDGIKELATEYRRMQHINHPNLLRGDHFDRWNNMPYLEMQFCEGGSLEKRIGNLTDIELISVIRDLCEGLQYLHRNGIIHQDIKPANILIDEHGHYLLSDFGISSRSRTRLSKSINMANVSNSAMTEAYAPPEKFSPKFEDRQPDAKGDIFSLGISLYELITGDLPFGSFSTGRQLQYEKLELDLAEIGDERIRTLIAWCMQREKEKRPTATELVSYLNNPHMASPSNHRQAENQTAEGGYGSDSSQSETSQTEHTTERMDNLQHDRSGDATASSVVREDTKTHSKSSLGALLGFLACVAFIIVGIIHFTQNTPQELYERARGTSGQKAARLYRRAAEKGHAPAQFNLGWCYVNGQGVAQDYTEAVKWYRKAAEQGHEDAQFILGCCYESGLGVTEDDTEAVEWYRKAAEQGNEYAQNSLGWCYANGQGVTEDYTEAVKWYRKAAEQGFVEAQFNLGLCYDNGWGVAQDYTEAVRWYRKAAEQGNAEAQFNLGWCYVNGQGVAQDYTESVKWFRKAAEQGDAKAQNNLGWCYDYGQGVTEDDTEAVEWYRKAAEQGHADAQVNLGWCYANGRGVAQDYTEAVKWYRKAAEQGNAIAQSRLKALGYTE